MWQWETETETESKYVNEISFIFKKSNKLVGTHKDIKMFMYNILA